MNEVTSITIAMILAIMGFLLGYFVALDNQCEIDFDMIEELVRKDNLFPSITDSTTIGEARYLYLSYGYRYQSIVEDYTKMVIKCS